VTPTPSRGEAGSGRALLVLNRRASRAEGALPRLREILARVGLEADVRAPEDPGSIGPLIREAGVAVRCIIVAGGDGTLHHAAPAILETGRPLGVVPLGTANDLARNLRIPLDPEQALRVIAAGQARWIDLGRVGDRLFFNVASFGLTGPTTRGLDRERKRRWGVLSYPVSALSALRKLRAFEVEIRDDEGGLERLRALHVEVANGRAHGGGVTVDREASMDDGLLTLHVIEARGLWRLAMHLPLLLLGQARWSRGVTVRDERTFRLSTSRALEVSADGEIVARTPATFSVEPRAVRVFVAEGGEP